MTARTLFYILLLILLCCSASSCSLRRQQPAKRTQSIDMSNEESSTSLSTSGGWEKD
ncbi:MAG: hypothetical protein MRZ63_11555 [Anaerostipes sp.]|uniref:hypothetical protein n=1 Tax=Anaerostipes sp. 992a TaxID=1261637 RepID=UPI001300D9D4|nr:hypothetical protein [Anaerostipes sp. 992a]MCI5952922.1 hypothetical protein [Anaerostipes sp.]MDD5969190.1 hypothetical protein [Anaerostipes sp.]